MTATMEEPRIVEFPAYTDAKNKLVAKQEELNKVWNEAGPDRDMNLVKSVSGSNDDKVAWIQKTEAEAADLHKEFGKMKTVALAAGASAARDDELGKESGDGAVVGPRAGGRTGRTSFAAEFVKSKAFTGYKPGMGQGPTDTLKVPLKALFDTSGWDPEVTRTGRIELFPTRPAPDVADYFPQFPTGQSAVRYMEETEFVNNASEITQGSQYPEGSFQLTVRTQSVEKVAIYIAVTDELFEDVDEAEAYVGQRLPFMLRQRLDSQLLAGNGSAPNLLGTVNVSGIQTQALGADPIPDAIYKGMRKVREDGYAEPDVVFIRPVAWEPVRLLKTAQGDYIWGSPSMPGPMTIWGVPVKETTAAPSGKAVLGDYQTFSGLHVRRGIDVQVSNSHADFFINGKLAVRADLRCAVVTYRPKAFCQVTGLPS